MPPRKPTMKKRNSSWVLSAIIALACFAPIYMGMNARYDRRLKTLQSVGAVGGSSWLEAALRNYYILKGEFPAGVVFDRELTWEKDSLYRAQGIAATPRAFVDPFARPRKPRAQAVYLPVYNRRNGLRESFILLSAGIDGRIDNHPADTLYTDDWWTKLRIYNLDEVMASVFSQQAFDYLYVRTRTRAGVLGDARRDGTWELRRQTGPQFSLFRRLFGRRDYVISYGLPYRIHRPMILRDEEVYDLNIGWTLQPQLQRK